jgi:hypothetical protein
MRPIPQSRILDNQYTNGTGINSNIFLRFPNSKIPYIGFYNIVNGIKYFSGKVYNDESKPLEKYNLLEDINKDTIKSVPFIGGTINSNKIRYFYKDLSLPDILIKEIDQKTYNNLNGTISGNYQVISFNSNSQNLEDVNKQMIGLKAFLVT